MRLRHWVHHFIVYGLGVILMNALPALMIPIYTYRVTPSIYGVLELLNRSQELLLLIMSFGLRTALLTFYQMKKGEGERQKNVYSTAIQFLCVFGLALTGIALVCSREISQLLFHSHLYTYAVVMILVGTYFEMVFQMSVLYLQSELKSTAYVSVLVTRSIAAILLNLVLVYWLRWGLAGILLATLTHTVVYAVATLIYVSRHTGFTCDRTLLKEMLWFGAPIVLGTFASFVLNNGDRYFLNIYSTEAAVGIYGLGYRIGMLPMTLILMPFGKIWSVTMVDISNQTDGSLELGRIATYLIAASAFSTLGISLLGPYLVRVLAQNSYWSAARLIPIVGLAYLFYSWTVVMDASFYVTKRTVYKLYIALLACVVVLLLYWLLIPKFGIMGAAWATLGGYLSFAAFTLLFAQRILRIQYEWSRIAWVMVISTALFFVGDCLPISPYVAGFFARSAFTLALPVILLLGGFATAKERRAIGDYLQSLRLRFLNGVRT